METSKETAFDGSQAVSPLPTSRNALACSTVGATAQIVSSLLLLRNSETLLQTAVLQSNSPSRHFHCVAFSPDGQLLVAGTEGPEARITVWEAEGERACIAQLMTREEDISALAFSATGKYLACISTSQSEARLCVWDWRAGVEVARQALKGPASCLAWSDSTTLVTAGSAYFKAWTLTRATGFGARLRPSAAASLTLVPRPSNLRSQRNADFVALAVAAVADGGTGLCALTAAGVVGYMHAAARDFEKLVDLKVKSVHLCVSKNHVAVATADGVVHILAAKSLIQKAVLDVSENTAGKAVDSRVAPKTNSCVTCAFSKKGELLVVSYSDGRLVTWDVKNPSEARVKAERYDCLNGQLTAFCLLPGGALDGGASFQAGNQSLGLPQPSRVERRLPPALLLPEDTGSMPVLHSSNPPSTGTRRLRRRLAAWNEPIGLRQQPADQALEGKKHDPIVQMPEETGTVDREGSKEPLQGKENSPARVPAAQWKAPVSPNAGGAKHAVRGKPERQRSEPPGEVFGKPEDPWEVLNPKSVPPLGWMAANPEETPRIAKERQFLRDDLAAMDKQLEALGKDWSAIKNRAANRGRLLKVVKPSTLLRASIANQTSNSAVSTARAQKRGNCPTLLVSEAKGTVPLCPQTEPSSRLSSRSPAIKRELSWTGGSDDLHTEYQSLSEHSETPENISRLAMRLSFSAADSLLPPQKRLLHFGQSSPACSTPESLASIDAAWGIQAKDIPTKTAGQGQRSATSQSSITLWASKVQHEGSVTPTFGKIFNSGKKDVGEAGAAQSKSTFDEPVSFWSTKTQQGSQIASPACSGLEHPSQPQRLSIDAVSQASYNLKGDAHLEKSPGSVPDSRFESTTPETGTAGFQQNLSGSFSFDLRANTGKEAESAARLVRFQGYSAPGSNGSDGRLSSLLRAANVERPATEDRDREDDQQGSVLQTKNPESSLNTPGYGRVLAADNTRAAALFESQSSPAGSMSALRLKEQDYTRGTLAAAPNPGTPDGLTPLLTAIEVPHGIFFTPDSPDEHGSLPAAEAKSSPKARWDNPFFDSSVSPKQSQVPELQFADMQLDNPAFESARGDTTARRRRQSLTRLASRKGPQWTEDSNSKTAMLSTATVSGLAADFGSGICGESAAASKAAVLDGCTDNMERTSCLDSTAEHQHFCTVPDSPSDKLPASEGTMSASKAENIMGIAERPKRPESPMHLMHAIDQALCCPDTGSKLPLASNYPARQNSDEKQAHMSRAWQDSQADFSAEKTSKPLKSPVQRLLGSMKFWKRKPEQRDKMSSLTASAKQGKGSNSHSALRQRADTAAMTLPGKEGSDPGQTNNSIHGSPASVAIDSSSEAPSSTDSIVEASANKNSTTPGSSRQQHHINHNLQAKFHAERLSTPKEAPARPASGNPEKGSRLYARLQPASQAAAVVAASQARRTAAETEAAAQGGVLVLPRPEGEYLDAIQNFRVSATRVQELFGELCMASGQNDSEAEVEQPSLSARMIATELQKSLKEEVAQMAAQLSNGE